MNVSMQKKLNFLIIGGGMYVCGRGTSGFGTVLPSVYQWAKKSAVGKVTICTTSQDSANQLKKKNEELQREFGNTLELDVLPESGFDEQSYLKALSGPTTYNCGIVAVPDHLHFEIAKTLIEAGLHVLIVKPMTPEKETARQLIQLAQQKNVYGAVEFHKRFDESNLKMKDVLQKGTLGVPLYFHVEYSQRKEVPLNYFRKWANQTDIFQYLGVHYVDLIYFVTGALPRRVLSIGQKGWLVSEGIDTYDAIQTMIEWQNGQDQFISNHLTNWIDPNQTSAMSDQKIKVIATKGRIESDQKHRGFQIVSDDNGIEDFNPYFSQMYENVESDGKNFSGYGYKSFQQFFDDVVSVVNQKTTPAQLCGNRSTFRSSFVSTCVIEASRCSLNQHNQWIEIDVKDFDILNQTHIATEVNV